MISPAIACLAMARVFLLLETPFMRFGSSNKSRNFGVGSDQIATFCAGDAQSGVHSAVTQAIWMAHRRRGALAPAIVGGSTQKDRIRFRK